MSDPFISVIIPVHNGSQTIGDCLEGVVKSTYPLFECIVVDDLSTDHTVEKANAFGVKVLRLKRQAGAAFARNRGAEAANGEILLFIDSDVQIYPDCLHKIVNVFKAHAEISAVFGSYDDAPYQSNFFSQYKNLFHHYVHQTSKEDASTFWSGLGAIKREVFFRAGKFNESCRMMEDIDLGYKLKANNYQIRLVKSLLVKHLKHYSFFSLLKSDLFDRAVPWTMIMLRNRQLTSDLNLKAGHKISTCIAFLLMFSILAGKASKWAVSIIPILLVIYFFINLAFYRFFIKKKGWIFTLKVIPFHFLYYLYGGLGFFMGLFKYGFDKRFQKQVQNLIF